MNPKLPPPRLKTRNHRADGVLAEHQESYRIEIIRKAIHLSSIAIPVLYLLTPRSVALSICVPLALLFLTVDIARYYNKTAEYWFYRFFGGLLRTHERGHSGKRLNGATYVLIAAALSIFIFPKFIAVTSFLILIISDMTAALIGRRFGRHKFLGKSLEGTMAFFFSAVLVIIFTPKIEYLFAEYIIGITGAAVGAIVEALPVRIDDNLSIPLSVGFTLWAAYAIFYPLLDLSRIG